jgi:hypothetical protein
LETGAHVSEKCRVVPFSHWPEFPTLSVLAPSFLLHDRLRNSALREKPHTLSDSLLSQRE